ncbi:MAG: hypothetical protein HFF87_11580 [Oscillibacter sp.]|jgi:O-antigen/teichoic acid export membrane protein|nr:hypothetical protein [Oscillibacter sp.]MCI9481230.1 hypothetical protein [Oscillibacter sp.]
MNRAEYLAKNVKFTMAGELLLAVLKFVSRRVFVLLLGKEYLGLNGLFTDVLSMLSVAELGFGVSITYSLYRPVACGDTNTVKSLMQLYRRIYRMVGAAVLAAGLTLTPFLDFFVKEMPENIPHIPLIYILNLLNTSISYFFIYKSTLLYVHQKKYVETAIRAGVTLAATGAQIAVLLLTGNYLYYLLLSIGATLVQNTVISVKANRLFPYLREKDGSPLPGETMEEIRRNVKAMLLHRVGTIAVFHTDNLLISKFVGIVTAGLYSNYTMIRNFLSILITALFDAVTPALGNLTATESQTCKQDAFCRLNFFSAWLFGWMSICLFFLYDPFMDLWLGSGYRLPKPAVLLIVLNFYMNSMRVPVTSSKSVFGLFWDDRYKSILEAVLNLLVSVLLAQRWGITGILLGTLISTSALPFWIEPLVLFRRGLNLPVRTYFFRYGVYLSVTVLVGLITGGLCQMTSESVLGFLIKTLLCTVVPNVLYIAVYCRTDEFHFLRNWVVHMIENLLAD